MSAEPSPRERMLRVATRRLIDVVGVRPEEVAPLVAAAGFQLSFIAGVAVLKAASNALLVGTRSLPLLYVASALATGGVAAFVAVARPVRKWPPTGTFAWWVATFVALAAGIHLEVPFAVEGLYLAAEVYATTLSVRFWASMGELFDVRASRRVLGLVGGVGMAGSILGGIATRALGESLGPLRLVPLACLSLVACLMIAPRLRSSAGNRSSPTNPVVRVSAPRPTRSYLFFDGLPRWMATFAALAAMTTAFADYLFRARAKDILEGGAQAALYGEISAVVGVVAMVVQLSLTNTLLKRVGLFGYLSLTPLACLVLGAIAVFVPGLWPVYALRAAEQVGALSLTQTGMQLLYGPMPDATRAAARNAVDGFAKKGGFALGGIALLVLASRLSQPRLSMLVAGVGLAALIAIWRLRAHYVRTIGERLQGTAPDAAEVDLLRVGTARQVLESALGHEDEGRVLTALELLGRDKGAKLEPHLAKVLSHSSAKVRAVAARLAGEHGAQTCAVRLAEMAAQDEGGVREAAIAAVAKLRPFTAPRLLGPLLSHPDLATRAAAIAALVPIDPAGPAGKALEELIERGSAALPGERAQVARLLGSIGGAHARQLVAYLQDPTPMVRRAACQAAGEAQSPVLVDELLLLLIARETRAEARSALARYGDPICTRLEAILNDRSAPVDLRYRVPRLLRDIGSPRALEIILFSNIADDAFLQYRLCMAASRIKEANPDIAFDRRRVLDATARRIDAYEELLPVSRDLAAALGPGNLLVRAIDDRLDQGLEGAIRLAGLVFPQRQLLNGFHRFIHGDPKTRPYAIELIEHTIEDGTLSRRLVSILENWHRKADWDDAGRRERAPGRLLELVASDDSMLKALTIVTVRRLRLAREGVAAVDAAAPLPMRRGEGSGITALARLARGAAWEMLLSAPPAIPEEGPMSEKVVETVLFLEGVDIFAESDVDDLAAVAQYVKERTFRKGETVYVENDPGDAMYVLVEGTVRIEKGRKHIVDLGPRDSFGETSLLDGKPRPATAKAATDIKVLVLDRADFMDLVADRVELLRGIFGAMTKHLRSVLDAAAAGRITSPGMTPVSLPKLWRAGGDDGSAPPAA